MASAKGKGDGKNNQPSHKLAELEWQVKLFAKQQPHQ
jgi:hypothetical protein